MDSKLTLKLDKGVIDKAKAYASSHNKSLSRMIESYLKSLTDKQNEFTMSDEISPFVKSMQSGVKLSSDIDHKEVYMDHLANKYDISG